MKNIDTSEQTICGFLAGHLIMQIFRTCLISLLGGMCFPSHAEIEGAKLWVNAGFYSAHFDAQKGLRNANTGIGIEYQLDTAWRLTAGRFINSDNVQSNYLGAYYQPWKVGDLKIGVVGGVFNGYPKAFNGGWFPAVLPVASWELGVSAIWTECGLCTAFRGSTIWSCQLSVEVPIS